MQNFRSCVLRAQQVTRQRSGRGLFAVIVSTRISRHAVARAFPAQRRPFHQATRFCNQELPQQSSDQPEHGIEEAAELQQEDPKIQAELGTTIDDTAIEEQILLQDQELSQQSQGQHEQVVEDIAEPDLEHAKTGTESRTIIDDTAIEGQPEVVQVEEQSKKTPAASRLKADLKELPLACPGCGAYGQTSDESAPGYYADERSDVRLYVARNRGIKSTEDEETDVVHRSLASLDSALVKSLGLEELAPTPNQQKASTIPVCGRCRALLYHNDLKQESIVHPSIESIRRFLDESPHTKNHIYHVIDAADFPMSLIPNISDIFDIAMRTKNRRSKSDKWSGGRSISMSFIITRADLIARNKPELDSMMPYLQAVLRDALGKHGEKIRLGNLWCVSARQSWWTKQLKEAVFEQGGGGWLVGKVNVGKSQLYNEIFPKGHKDRNNKNKDSTEEPTQTLTFDDSHPLLPPVPLESNYPPMPIASPLPGTTALPVRNRYGNSKGELIDLPGLPREGLSSSVDPEKAPTLYHGHRINAEQYTILPGNSLLISNLISIRATDPNMTILAAPFLPIGCSVRENSFAEKILAQTQIATTAANLARTIASPQTATSIASAGTFRLEHDITKSHSGPLTRRDAVGLKPANLPFIIYGLDILVEGCGWIELQCQVRRRFMESQPEDWRPEVEVMSPHGKFVGCRRPMGAFLRIGQHRKPVSQRTQRPRRSMKGVKKEMKRRAREIAGGAVVKPSASGGPGDGIRL